VLAHAALAALLICLGDLAAHICLNQLEGRWVCLAIASVPSAVGWVDVCDFKQNDRMAKIGATELLPV
jgi:hypothetical protein